MSFLKRKREGAAIEVATAPPEPVSTTIAAIESRQLVRVCGKVTRMTARPTTGQPALAVSIADETGTVTAVWTGRRGIGGVTLGRRLAVEGVPMRHGNHFEFTNPKYTLLER